LLCHQQIFTVLSGLIFGQLQGFSRAKQLINKDYCIFTKSYLKEIEMDLKQVGFEPFQQSDHDLPKHTFHLDTYLIHGAVLMALLEER